MSIASEIEDLTTNLAAAKAAVTTKGGTVGNTGLAGLATEIASIPSGGGGGGWGTITYLDTNNQERTVTIQTAAEFFSLGSNTASEYTIDGKTFNKTAVTQASLGSYAAYIPDYFLYNCTNLVTITGVDNIVYCGARFLNGCSNLNCELNFTILYQCGDYFLSSCTKLNNNISLPSVGKIGNYFLNSCSQFNHSLNISSVNAIGTSFLSGCTKFNQPISLPGLTKISNGFMTNCYAFDQSLTLPSTVTSVGASFMNNCRNFTSFVCNADPTGFISSDNTLSTTYSSSPLYATGVTVSGTYATELKAKFPDRTTSPYRKLIVAS